MQTNFVFRIKHVVPLDRRRGAWNFLVLLLATAGSIGTHVMVNVFYNVLDSWSLVFFRGLIQTMISVTAYFARTKGILACCPCFGERDHHGKAIALVSKKSCLHRRRKWSSIFQGFITFLSTLAWLYIEEEKFISGIVTSIFYLCVPLLSLVLEFVSQK